MSRPSAQPNSSSPSFKLAPPISHAGLGNRTEDADSSDAAGHLFASHLANERSDAAENDSRRLHSKRHKPVGLVWPVWRMGPPSTGRATGRSPSRPPTAHHGVLLFAAVLVLLLLAIESRRYRFFDVYRSRVRRLERNYFASIFSPTRAADDEWMRRMTDDLQRPAFSISLTEAMSRRLRRNYFWMFIVVFWRPGS